MPSDGVLQLDDSRIYVFIICLVVAVLDTARKLPRVITGLDPVIYVRSDCKFAGRARE
jgi:hypothetical protein